MNADNRLSVSKARIAIVFGLEETSVIQLSFRLVCRGQEDRRQSGMPARLSQPSRGCLLMDLCRCQLFQSLFQSPFLSSLSKRLSIGPHG
jgi:hypothetical protein